MLLVWFSSLGGAIGAASAHNRRRQQEKQRQFNEFRQCRIQLTNHIQSNLSILKEKIGIELWAGVAVRPSIARPLLK